MPTVKLFANLRKIAGQKELSIAPPAGMLHSASRGTTLNSVLTGLVQQVPALDGVILENGQIRPNIIITVNGQNATDPNLTVSDQDTIAIFPPIAGG